MKTMRPLLRVLVLLALVSCDAKRQPPGQDSTPPIDSIADTSVIFTEIPDDPNARDDASGVVNLSRRSLALIADTTPILDTVWQYTAPSLVHRAHTDSAQVLDTIGWNFPPPPPPPPIDTTTPPLVPPPAGLPPGFSLVGLQDCTQRKPSGWTERGDAALSIFIDPVRGAVCRATYRAGFGGGAGPVQMGHKVSKPRAVFMSFYIRFSPNWEGHPSLVNKIFHLWSCGGGKCGNHLLLVARGAGSGALQAEVRLQGMNETPVSRNLRGSQYIPRGKWVRWDVLTVASSGGQANGTVQWWINGVPAGLYTNLNFAVGTSVWDNMSWAPTWGGVGGNVAALMQMDVDDWLIGVQ